MKDPVREVAPTSGTINRRWPIFFRPWSGRFAKQSLTYNQLPSGGLTFRQRLPLGSGFDIVGPCADGHFGAIIKTYREWKTSGTTRAEAVLAKYQACAGVRLVVG